MSITRLPIEIISFIFGIHVYVNLQPRWPLLLVCGEWYRIAVGHIPLWTTISWRAHARTMHVQDICRSSLDLARDIGRTKKATFDLLLECPARLHATDVQAFNAAIEDQDWLSRCKSLIISSPVELCDRIQMTIGAILRLENRKFTALEHLGIITTRDLDWDNSLDEFIHQVTHSAPNLYSLELHEGWTSLVAARIFRHVDIPHRIRRLQLNFVNIPVPWALFNNLEHLDYNRNQPRYPIPRQSSFGDEMLHFYDGEVAFAEDEVLAGFYRCLGLPNVDDWDAGDGWNVGDGLNVGDGWNIGDGWKADDEEEMNDEENTDDGENTEDGENSNDQQEANLGELVAPGLTSLCLEGAFEDTPLPSHDIFKQLNHLVLRDFTSGHTMNATAFPPSLSNLASLVIQSTTGYHALDLIRADNLEQLTLSMPGGTEGYARLANTTLTPRILRLVIAPLKGAHECKAFGDPLPLWSHVEEIHLMVSEKGTTGFGRRLRYALSKQTRPGPHPRECYPQVRVLTVLYPYGNNAPSESAKKGAVESLRKMLVTREKTRRGMEKEGENGFQRLETVKVGWCCTRGFEYILGRPSTEWQVTEWRDCLENFVFE